jgi:hypothetical protein
MAFFHGGVGLELGELHQCSIPSATLVPMSKLSIFSELWSFMRVRKKWWLLPIIMLIAVLGLILVFAQGSALAPFIYTVF